MRMMKDGTAKEVKGNKRVAPKPRKPRARSLRWDILDMLNKCTEEQLTIIVPVALEALPADQRRLMKLLVIDFVVSKNKKDRAKIKSIVESYSSSAEPDTITI